MTASMAWPSFHPGDRSQVAEPVAAPAETRTPNLHRANIAHPECGGKAGDSGEGHNGLADSTGSDTALPRPWASFLPRVMVAERSSPSRVRLRRAERALDRSGPLCKTAARKKRKNGDQKGKQNLTPAGLLMEGHYISNPETGRLLVIWGCYANNTMVPSGRKLTICTKGGTAEYPTSFFESTRGRYATVSTRRNLLFPHTGVTLHQCRSGEPRMESSYSGIVSIYPRPLSPGFVPESATAAASTVFAKVTRLCNFSR